MKTDIPQTKKHHLKWLAPLLKIISTLVVLYELRTVIKPTSINPYLITCGCALVPLLLLLAQKVFKTDMPTGVDIIVLSFVILAADVGSALGYYGKLPYFDLIVHCYSGFVGPLVMAYFWRRFTGACPKVFGTFCLFLISMGFSALWECWEFFMDVLINQGSQGGLTDTMTDILISAVGASVFALVYLIDLDAGGKLFRMDPYGKKKQLK